MQYCLRYIQFFKSCRRLRMLIFYPRLIVLAPIKADVVSWASSQHFRSRPVCQLYPGAPSVPAGEQPWDQIWGQVCPQTAVRGQQSQNKRRFDRSSCRWATQTIPCLVYLLLITLWSLCMGCLTVLTHHGSLFWLCAARFWHRREFSVSLWFLAVASCWLRVSHVHHVAAGPVTAPGHTHRTLGAKVRFFY